MAKFYFSKSYEKSLSVIEDFIFDSTQSIDNRQANLKIYPNNSLPTYYEKD